MNRNKLRRLRQQLEALRQRGGVKARELKNLATALGRKRHKRGSEPTWVSDIFPDSRPVSIPDHPGDLNKHTARGILDQLEGDLERLEGIYSKSKGGNPDE